LPATVDYLTSDDTANQKFDYTLAFGTLSFAAGEASKTFTVLLTDNAFADGDRNVVLFLTNPNGVTLDTQIAGVLTIADNDPQPSTANPIDGAQFYVRQHYADFLNRFPDQGGFAFWTNEITSCSSNQACIELKRINVSAAYFLSIEFQQTGYLVERLYKTAYGDTSGTSTFGGTHQLPVPMVRFTEFLSDTQRIGRGVVVGETGWETVLENNKQAFTSEFVQRSRFTAAFPTSLTPAQFVDMLFANAGVTPSSSDRNAAIGEFVAATDTKDTAARGRALRRVAENSTLNQQEFNRAFVLMQYFGYLRRNPNDPQDTDYTGYDFWLTKLNQFNGDFVNAEMVKAFIASGEYRNRFGP
jgi:Calx-beta domain